jgi:hypothetical protein
VSIIDSICWYAQKVPRAILAAVVSILMISCYRAYSPSRPDGVPSSAVWAGGLDGGGWVTCTESSRGYNLCTIYDEEGRTRGPAPYRLKDLNRAAEANELKYTYVTGKAIGLKGGRELVQISVDQTVPLRNGDGHTFNPRK